MRNPGQTVRIGRRLLATRDGTLMRLHRALVKSHRNVLETFDELPALPRPPTRAMRNGRTWANSGGAASHSLRPAFKGSGRHRRSGSPPSSVVPHPRTSHQPVPHRPPTRPPSHPPSRGRERGPRDPSLRPTPGMARSAEELFTDLTTELMFGVRLGSQDDLADVGCRRYDTEVASQCALPPPYRAATLIGTTIPSPVPAFWGGRVDPRAVHRTEQVFCGVYFGITRKRCRDLQSDP